MDKEILSKSTMQLNKMVVLIPFRNVGTYIIDCISAILGQEYKNYTVYLLDDASDDKALNFLNEEIENFKVIRREKRVGSLENIYLALANLTIEEEDIIVIIDGDDYIFGEFAFQILNNIYNKSILLTYGQYITNYGFYEHCAPYTIEEYENLRKAPWKASHLKTFKFKLFKAFLQQDPNAENFKYSHGGYSKNRFYMSTSDQALMLPLMEIAGYENIVAIPNILYCYRIHPNNDHNTIEGRKLQLEALEDIRNRKPLNRMF